MRIGIFGGTFDPPHIGHLILAAESKSQLNLDRLLWVLTPDPPHKQNMRLTSVEERLEMVQAAIQDDPAFELSRVEIDRPGPHYAVETVHLLAKAFPDADLAYLIGGDSLRDLPTWYHPQELVDACAMIGVMRRPGDEVNMEALETQLPGIKAKAAVVKAPLLEISATEIRSRIAAGKPFRYYLPEAVYKIIRERGLYSQDSSD
jgi:nicotinate-nucleotide adenylyltransferase